MPFGLLEGLAVAQAGVGLIGSMFGKNEQPRGLGLLKKRAKQGIDPKVLALMRLRARRAVGNEGSALSSQAQNRLLRSNAPIAKQEEVLASLSQKRIGAAGEALTSIDIANEQVKSQALQQLTSLAPEPGTGAAFGELLGMGLGSLQSSLEQTRYQERLNKLLSKYGQSGGSLQGIYNNQSPNTYTNIG